MKLFNRSKKIRTPEALVAAQFPEVASRIVGVRHSHLSSNYVYVFLDDFTLPNFVACLETQTVAPIEENESARTCLLRTASTTVV